MPDATVGSDVQGANRAFDAERVMATSDFTKLNHRKRKYIDARSQGLSKRQAKNIAGYAASTSSYSVENSSVKAALARLIRQAVPAHVIVQRIAEGMSAEETKFFQKEGRVMDERNVVAWSERREYLKLAAEYGLYVEPDNDKVKIGEGGPTFVLINGITKPKRDFRIDNAPQAIDVERETPVLPTDKEEPSRGTSFVLVNGITTRKQ
jgi:hypothetical protein